MLVSCEIVMTSRPSRTENEPKEFKTIELSNSDAEEVALNIFMFLSCFTIVVHYAYIFIQIAGDFVGSGRIL